MPPITALPSRDAEEITLVSADHYRRLMSMAEHALEALHSDWIDTHRGSPRPKPVHMKGEERGAYTSLLLVLYRLHRGELNREGIRDFLMLPSSAMESDLHWLILERLSNAGRLQAFGRGPEPGHFKGRLAFGHTIQWEAQLRKDPDAFDREPVFNAAPRPAPSRGVPALPPNVRKLEIKRL